MKKSFLLVCVLLVMGLMQSCKENPPFDPPMVGCTDPMAMNYDPTVTVSYECEYADQYFPAKTGNWWDFEDEFDFPFVGTVNVEAHFEMMKDTLIEGEAYVVSEETVTFSNPTVGDFDQVNRYAYKMEANGKVWRIDLGSDTLAMSLFLDYPLSLNHTWHTRTTQDEFLCRVIGQSILDVPAGSFGDVFQVDYEFEGTGSDSIPQYDFVVFFVKDIGWGRTDIDTEVDVPQLGTIPVNVQLELVDYYIN